MALAELADLELFIRITRGKNDMALEEMIAAYRVCCGNDSKLKSKLRGLSANQPEVRKGANSLPHNAANITVPELLRHHNAVIELAVE
jgi:hypothetical protein